VAVFPVGLAFGLAAAEAGLAVWQASAFSVLVFAGSSQFAAVDIIGDGGSPLTGIAAGVLLNVRSLAFGVVMASALAGTWWKRAVWSQLMVDEAAAMGAAQSDWGWRRYSYQATGVAIFISWNLATLLGAATLSSGGDVLHDWGIDAAFPAIFLALLWPRLAEADQRRSAIAGALIALLLVPIAPPGVPVVVAALGVVAGWRVNSRATT
jgi:predicted branched-subunit amino acid permease